MAIHILLIEDSPGDAKLLEDIFQLADPDNRVHVAVDGESALAFLRNEGTYADATHPNLILLDLTLPGIHGIDVLAQIKADVRLRTIPVIVLATTITDSDLARCENLMVSCCVSKPVHLDEFEALAKFVGEFWLNKARLPPRLA